MLTKEMRGDAFWRQLPSEIRAGLTEEQEAAIRAVAAETEPAPHPVDYRLSCRVPLMGTIYMVLLAGRERRNPMRRSLDHALKPLNRLTSNLLTAGVIAGIGLATGAGLLIYDAFH
jgi:hypothetical protein